MKKWLWGDGHCHSNFSDGFHSIEELTGYYEQYEMDFRFQTDHLFMEMPEKKYIPHAHAVHGLIPEIITEYCNKCRAASTSRHLVIPGAELGLIFKSPHWELHRFLDHHMLIRPLAGNNIPVPGNINGTWWPHFLEAVIKSAADSQLAFAHVSDATPWQFLPTLPCISPLEVLWNLEVSEPLFKRKWFLWWDYLLSLGKKIFLTTGSDSHQADLWCAGSMRNVVWIEGNADCETVCKSFQRGNLYLSGTFHPDVWKETGETGIKPERNAFTPWFCLEQGIVRKNAEKKVMSWINSGLHNNHGRVKRSDFPQMTFNVNNKTFGETVQAEENKPVNIDCTVHAHLPVSRFEIFAGGDIIYSENGLKSDFSKNIELMLKGKPSYIRIQIFTQNENGKQEALIGNPVWIE